VVCSDPLNLPLPRGVRIASKTSASVVAIVVGAPRRWGDGCRQRTTETFVRERKYLR
jgi:hypothetical protein